jgi:hypothetical protein
MFAQASDPLAGLAAIWRIQPNSTAPRLRHSVVGPRKAAIDRQPRSTGRRRRTWIEIETKTEGVED